MINLQNKVEKIEAKGGRAGGGRGGGGRGGFGFGSRSSSVRSGNTGSSFMGKPVSSNRYGTGGAINSRYGGSYGSGARLLYFVRPFI